MTTEKNIDKDLIKLVSQYTTKEIPDDMNCDLMDELGIDSMNWMSLLMDIESEFNIEFEDELFFSEDLMKLSQIKRNVLNLLKE